MSEPIYPNKTKTGLAALKPLTDAFFAEPERWQWEHLDWHDKQRRWDEYRASTVIPAVEFGHWDSGDCRLTPKPRRVWIGDQELLGVCERFPDVVAGCWIAALHLGEVIPAEDVPDFTYRAYQEGLLFWSREAALHGLDAYRKARRVE